MPRFYLDRPISERITQTLTLSDAVYHHWCKVLRAKLGDEAVLFDGTGGEYAVHLVQIDKKNAQVQLDGFHPINRTPPFQVTLGLVMSRGERMDYAVQKATEMGVHQIQLLTSERCQAHLKYERDLKKITHWQSVAIAACEQCGLNIVPQIIPPITLQEWVADCEDTLKYVMAISDGSPDFSQPLPKQIALLVGAEGGLSDDEINFAKSHGFTPWTIGERVLRTETAPVAAMAALQMVADLQGLKS